MHRKFILLLIALFCLNGCITIGANKSAVAQISAEQNPKIEKLAAAAYYDVLGLYTELGKTYLDYRDMLEAKNPKANKFIKDSLNEMKAFLDKWKALDAVAKLKAINEGDPEFRKIRREVLFELAEYLEGGS
jgi:restriction endonuclease